MGGSVSHARLVAVGALAVLFVAGGGLDAWALTGLVTVILVALCAFETVGERRTAPALSP
jgi:hypothetical protein